MKKNYFFQRQWAETVRLYSGLLEGQERITLIKEIAKEDILLAAECRTISILDENELDDYLTKVALTQAKQFKLSETSAKGIMALVELNKFDEITQIFSTIKDGSKSPMHNQVVANYISNGSELQISTFLVVLSESNKMLLDRAIDRAFDIDIFFSPYSIVQLESLINNFYNQNDFLLAAKINCLISKRIKTVNAQKLLDALLKNKQIKYAEKIVAIYKLSPFIDIYGYLKKYLKENLPEQSLLRFLNLSKKVKKGYDLSQIRLEVSKHLNPRIKALAFKYEADIPLSQELIYSMYLENIKLANHSSIEFALSLVENFNLHDKIGIESIVENLLSKPKGRRLELAYRLIKENNLSQKYSYELLFDFALNGKSYESYILAKRIVIEKFQKEDIFETLIYLCCIMITEIKAYKVAREIVLKDLQTLSDLKEFEEHKLYYGFVTNYYKKNYQIDIGLKGLQINAPKEKTGHLQIHDFVRFELITKNEKISDSFIEIRSKNLIQDLHRMYYFGKLFYGKLLELRVEKFDEKNIYLDHLDYAELQFIVTINEIANTYVKSISEFVSINEVLMAKIIAIDRYKRIVFCSIKNFERKFNENENINTEEFDKKIENLKSKFSRK